jgi:S-adenosylmethionine:tRNA ribosyltransferase-isomerase
MLSEFLEKYSYELPEGLVRKVPLALRHNSKLLVYDTKNEKIYHDIFLNLDKYLPENSKLILNKTKVLPARLRARGEQAGKWEIFLVLNEWSGVGDVACFTQTAISKSKTRDNPKVLYSEILGPKGERVEMKIYKGSDGITYFKNVFSTPDELYNFLEKYGETPVPPYLLDEDIPLNETETRSRYQTVFAESGKSVAAPTASLHFTKEVFKKLENKNIQPEYVNLDIGRGTFSNITEKNLSEGKLHKEYYSIPKRTIEVLDNTNIIKVAVGTTTVRTIETFGSTGRPVGETDIFIKDNFNFKYTDILITNFHQPQTSLMALVDSFLKHKQAKYNITDIYKIAIQNKYSFYSFGDSMLIF